jgi:hypothetical protein
MRRLNHQSAALGLRQHTKLSDEEIKATAVEKLKLVGLQNVENLMPSELVAGYPWVYFPQELLIALSVFLLFGYVAVTLAFVVNLVRKRVKAGKTLGTLGHEKKQRVSKGGDMAGAR